MDIEDNVVWAILVIAIAFTICFMFGMDKRQERIMAERGYCYQAVDRLNDPGSWQYQKCR